MTLVFAAVMALVLGATGVFVYLRFENELDATINAGLRSRASDVAALVKEGDPGLREGNQTLVGASESFAEVLGTGGNVTDASRSVGGRLLLSAAESRRALREPVYVDRGPGPGLQEESRLLAVPVETQQRAGRSSSSAPRSSRATSRSPTSPSCSWSADPSRSSSPRSPPTALRRQR